ncbi:hypothetical protein SLEP1_g10176 [Rubroshorea leprosula]|uniref:Uncharacterized protein n=1 Tax=Rubroshorea leprosula TaxID=152421 RepID=A0AAV5ID57_9ROSI|nr:hypothetical protein SLEP1_g10176 [Rubroshorea leprosula]
MAQGFIDFDDDDDSPLELKGFEYFQCLKAHCFFQDFEYEHEHLICKIHDLVHDFALFLTRGEFMTLEISKGNASSTMKKERTVRHLTVMVEKGLYFPEFIPGAEKLRGVVARGNNIRDDCAAISEKAMCNLFNQARRLRAVFMVRNVASTIPEEIGNLLHLRYLNLALNSNLKKLPKALFRLHNLQHLFLYHCYNLERLPDAEEKQISDEPVKLWLDRLKEESLDMEDALDEWRTVLLYRRTDGAEKNASFLQRKVRVFLRCFSFHPVRYHGIARNIKEINRRLHKIAADKANYQLTSMPISKLPRQAESKSFIDESSLLGRDDVKNEIISHLLCETSKKEEGSPIQTISLVGIGGIGKTALAQLVYNDENVKQHFPCRVWTCVSNIFNESKVAKAIIVGLQGLDELAVLQLESVPLDALLDKICKSIEGKKYLLVLDDVWTEKDKDFEGLNATFKCGDPGSRILVTTRKSTVATIMGSSHTIQLNNLSREICWFIIRNIALRGKDQRTCEEFKPIGLKIAEKCKGLPLVAKTLGGLLRFKTGIQGWEHVLNSELWRMGMVHKDVFVPLLLSYYDLPSPVKQCFTYLAIHPKDELLFPCDMISQWMAQGYLGVDDDDSPLELKGSDYFQCLEARCFFQDFEERSLRHLTVRGEEGLCFPEFIPNAEKLRSVEAHCKISGDCAAISEKAMCNLFNQARRLRLVGVAGYDGSTIPEEIGNLLHLRYFDLDASRNLKKLPKALFKLHNLEHLSLYGCYNLERLPDEIGNLVNLKLLDTEGCDKLACYPKEVVRLTQLTQLLGLIVRIDRDDPEEFSIGDLAKLNKLLVLSMEIVGNKINVGEAKKVKLQNLQEVKILVDGDIAEAEHVILESLNISTLEDNLPAAIMQSCLPQITIVTGS